MVFINYMNLEEPKAPGFIIFQKILLFMYMCVGAHVCRYSWRPEEDVRGAGAGVTDDVNHTLWELELNSGPPQEIVLTTEPYL